MFDVIEDVLDGAIIDIVKRESVELEKNYWSTRIKEVQDEIGDILV
jgi:hypothetical protein